jgi:hypothetical protein
MDIFVLLGLIGTGIGIILIIFHKNLFVRIKDPNIGIVYQNGELLEDAPLYPGLHFLIQKVGPWQIHEVTVMPGREEIIDIPVDGAFSDNVEVKMNVRIRFRLQQDDDQRPTLESAIILSRSYRLLPGETLFSTKVNGETIRGKLDFALTGAVLHAITRVIVKFPPALITASPMLHDELVEEIRRHVWSGIRSWAQDLTIEVEDLDVPDETARRKRVLDAIAQAEAVVTDEQAYLKVAEQAGKMFGQEAAVTMIAGRAFGGSNFTVISDGLGGLLKTLSKIGSTTPEPDITASPLTPLQARRLMRNRRNRRK